MESRMKRAAAQDKEAQDLGVPRWDLNDLEDLSSFEFWILLYRPLEIHPRLWVLTEDEQTAVCGFPTSQEKQFLFNHLIEILQYAKLNFVVWVNLKTEIVSSGGHPYQKKAPESIGIQWYEKAMSAESPAPPSCPQNVLHVAGRCKDTCYTYF